MWTRYAMYLCNYYFSNTLGSILVNPVHTTMFWRDALRLLWYSGITSQLNAFQWVYRPHHGLVSRVLNSTWFHCSPTVGTLQPVPVRDFADHVKFLHANDDYLFTEEYGVSFAMP